jgi:CHAT domain-containing protein
VATLEALVVREPANPDDWNDLAAARLADGEATDDVHEIAKSLAAADEALALQPAHAAALFNRGLALDALGLRFAATDAWRRYLSVDSTSAWAVEARERLAASDQPTRDEQWKREEVTLDHALDRGDTATVDRIVARFPEQARTAVETSHLPAWADALLAGNLALADKSLARARLIAASLKKYNGDGLLDQVVSKTSESSALAFHAYGQGRADNTARRVKRSLERFIEAERGFASAGNPMELSAAYFRANALVDLGRLQESESIGAQIEARLDPSYRSLHAHLLWLRGRQANDAAHDYESLLANSAAREAFEQLGEVDYAARRRTPEAAMLARLGRDREAWQSRRASLTGAAASGKWNLVEVAIEAIAREEVNGPDRDIARSLFNVQVAAPSALPLMRFNGLLWNAFLEAGTAGRPADFSAARTATANIPDTKQRDDSLDELRLAEGLAIRESQPLSAERLFSDVIDYRTRAGLPAFLPSIFMQRARVRRTLRNLTGAEEDLRHAVALIESRRERIASDTLRDTFLGRSEDAYEELGELLLTRGDWIGAFEISERARSRVLLDKAGRGAMSMAEIVAGIPPSVVGAHFTSFRSRTLLVILEHGRATHRVIDVDRSELASLRDRLTANPDSQPASRRLYELLIAPLHDQLAAGRMLVIAPDETIYGVPFAALRNASGGFLIDETAIAIAPAGAALTGDSQTLIPKQSSVTILGDPAFSTKLFPNLKRLPAAGDDARSVKSIFGHTTALIGNEATLRALKQAAAECNVLHVAAHAFSSPRDASLSLIALTPEAGDEGLLYLGDIASLALANRPLVVLAGCQTGSFGGGTGSMRSLANAFLGAGSRAVLATLWNVDDEPTSELTTRFYRSLASGLSLPAALREAQLQARQTRPVREWSAFQIHLGVKPTVLKNANASVIH